MKIFYDHQIFTLQSYGGISRYFCELMDQFSQDPDIEQTLALRYSYNENLCNRHSLYQYWSSRSKSLCDAQISPAIQKVKHVALKRLRINQREAMHLLKKQDFDILHPTYYDPYFLQYLQKKPFVLTVYDMIHELYPDYFPRNDPTAVQKKKLIEQADAIIAISESTKSDIMQFANIDPDRISVVYLGSPFEHLNLPQQTPNLEDLTLEKPYILIVGNRNGY